MKQEEIQILVFDKANKRKHEDVRKKKNKEKCTRGQENIHFTKKKIFIYFYPRLFQSTVLSAFELLITGTDVFTWIKTKHPPPHPRQLNQLL